MFQSIFEVGEMTITIGVSGRDSERIFYDSGYAAGATANYTDNAAIRLQSII